MNRFCGTRGHSLVVASPKPKAQKLKKSRLLALPSELRNLIWQYTLTENDPIVIGKGPTSLLDSFLQIYKPLPQEPALLCTCKQIRLEAALMYYSCNEFTYEDHSRTCYPAHTLSLSHFLSKIGKTKARAISRLTLSFQPGLRGLPITDFIQMRRPSFFGPSVCTEWEAAERVLDQAAERMVWIVRKSGVRLDAVVVKGPPLPLALCDAFAQLWAWAVEDGLDEVKRDRQARVGRRAW